MYLSQPHIIIVSARTVVLMHISLIVPAPTRASPRISPSTSPGPAPEPASESVSAPEPVMGTRKGGGAKV